MSLFEKWSGKITLPALPPLKTKVGRNFIVLFPTEVQSIDAKLFDTDTPGYELLTTSLPAPFDVMYLRRKRARRRPFNKGSLTVEDGDPAHWNVSTAFEWDDTSAILEACSTPEKITGSWTSSFRFTASNEATDTVGLRMPQLGALHAISAHFSVGREHDPATVVLPTGTGKTETMLASLVYQQPRRLLVLVPSDALRTQIGEKFEHLGLLRKLGCIPEHSFNPRVLSLTSGIRTLDEARAITEGANVVVALPNTLEASDPEASTYLCEQFSTLFVDEAHHVTAATWKKIRDRFLGKDIVQFTATPFRRNREHIGGRIIFNYKLSDAQRDGYYTPIRLETVEEFGQQEERDRAIAERALAILAQDTAQGHQHLIMARTGNTQTAETLVGVYRELAPELRPVVMYTGPGRAQENDNALAALKSGESKVIVCVNMLGEGFDLPQLKIAAIHDYHKSLAVTLQFIGRFTRRADNVGHAAAVVNIADVDAEKRLEELYAEGADWDQIISRLSETEIEGELRLQDLIESLKSDGTLHKVISLWNLRPTLSTQIYRTRTATWSPSKFEDAFPEGAQLWHSISETEKLLIVVSYQETDVKWGSYEDLLDGNYDLLIAHWDSSNNVLFVHASDYDAMKVSEISRLITSDETQLLNGPIVFNVLNDVELALAKSLGSSRLGAISFSSYFGPNVTEGLASIEKRESELNNIAVLGYENGDKVTWGAAQRKGKIWQQKSDSIDEWMLWCKRTYSKLSDGSADTTNITRDFLRPTKLEQHYSHPAISVQWGEYLQSSFSDSLAVLFGEESVPLLEADVHVLDDNPQGEIRFSIFAEDHRSTYTFRIDPSLPRGYQYQLLEGPEVSFRVSRKVVRTFEEQMYIDPFIIRYSDGTYSYNNFHIPFDLEAGNYPTDHIESWDWSGVALNEESMGASNKENSIQFRTFQNIADEFAVIFNDDGPGEAGDLVCLKDNDDGEIVLCLVHCKNAKGGKVTNDITNLYTLCGQAQKSISVKHQGLKKLATDLKRRHDKWSSRGASRILKGDFKTLSYFVEKARKTKVNFEVVLVQPGMSRASLTPDMAKLLATTELFLKRTTEAQFRVVGSD